MSFIDNTITPIIISIGVFLLQILSFFHSKKQFSVKKEDDIFNMKSDIKVIQERVNNQNDQLDKLETKLDKVITLLSTRPCLKSHHDD